MEYADLEFTHDLFGIANGGRHVEGDGIEKETTPVTSSLYGPGRPALAIVMFFVDHADAAFESHSNRHLCFGNGIHRCRNDRNVQFDVSPLTGLKCLPHGEVFRCTLVQAEHHRYVRASKRNFGGVE